MSLKQARQPMLAVIYDSLARQELRVRVVFSCRLLFAPLFFRYEWEDMAAKCPQSFDLEAVMSRQDPDLLRRAQDDFDAMFKESLLFDSLHSRMLFMFRRMQGTSHVALGHMGNKAHGNTDSRKNLMQGAGAPASKKVLLFHMLSMYAHHSVLYAIVSQFKSNNVATTEQVIPVCWNCGKTGHKKPECDLPLQPKGKGKGKGKAKARFRFVYAPPYVQPITLLQTRLRQESRKWID